VRRTERGRYGFIAGASDAKALLATKEDAISL